MAKIEVEARSAYLKTSEKLPDRFLYCGKIEDKNDTGKFYFYLIEVLSPWFPSSKVQRAILSILEKSILTLKSGAADKVFENAVQKINEALAKMIENGEKDWIGNLNSIIGLISKNDIVITQTGNISGYIFRKGKISSITEKGSANSPVTTFEDITCGKLSQEDRIIFANIELYNHFSLDNLRHICDNKSSAQIISDLSKVLRRIKVRSVNAIVLDGGSKDTTETTELPDILFLDEPEESVVSVIKRRIAPYTQKASRQTKEISTTITSQSKAIWHRSREEWNKKYGSKAKGHQNPDDSKKMASAKVISLESNAKTNKEPKSKVNVKTFSYTNKSTGNLKSKTRIPLISMPSMDMVKEFVAKLVNFCQGQNKKYLYIALIFLLIFVGFIKVRSNNSDRTKKIELEQVASSYEEAVATYGQAKQDIALGKDTGASKLDSALSLATKALANKNNESKAKDLIGQIQKTADEINKTTRFSNLTPMFGLGENTANMALAGSEIYGINMEGKIYAADTREKESKLVASIGKEYGTPVSLTYSKTPNKIFIYTSTGKVLSYEVESKTYSELKIIDDSGKWEDAKSMVSFVSNLYLLDSEAGEIWKHIERTGGYSRGTRYANTAQKSIRGAVDAAIDGDLYILQNDATVAKFNKSIYDANFSLKPLPAPNSTIDIPAQIYTDPDSTDLFILDKKLNRIVKFNKVGDFIGQYAFDNIQIERFVINAKLQKLWVLSEDNIYEINL